MAKSNETFAKRQARVRRSVKKNSSGRPRLSVHRSSEHIYAQVIDDAKGATIAAASSSVLPFTHSVTSDDDAMAEPQP